MWQPLEHVYVPLTDASLDGPLIHISPQDELEEGHGLYAALRSSLDDDDTEADEAETVVDDLDELMTWVEDHQGAAAPDAKRGC